MIFHRSGLDHCRRTLVAVTVGLALAWLAVLSEPTFAQVTYRYAGNNFTVFSCGMGSIRCASPPPGATSYTTDDFVTATLTFDAPLPPNLNRQDVRGVAGFSLTMDDGHQELTMGPGTPGEVIVSTDASGNIIAPWSVFIHCCLFPNNNIFTLNDPGQRGIGDGGALSMPNGSFPDTPMDSGEVNGSPGIWVREVSSPADLTEHLIKDVNALIGVELNPGQAKRLSRPLRNVLRSIRANKIQPACSQLQDFIAQVINTTPPLSQATSDALIASANAIRTVLSCR
jgi:hypothetical protein